MSTTLYVPKYLKPEELVDEATYKKASNKQYIFWQFNPLILITADMLRERFGSIVVNNWSSGGSFSQRGLRSDDSSVGATFSAHKRGAALDCSFKNATAEEVREEMRKAGCFQAGFRDKTDLGNNECFRYIGRVESTQGGKPISWFHFDICNAQNPDGSIDEIHV